MNRSSIPRGAYAPAPTPRSLSGDVPTGLARVTPGKAKDWSPSGAKTDRNLAAVVDRIAVACGNARGPEKVLICLAWTAGEMNHAADQLLVTPSDSWPAADEVAAALADALAVRRDTEVMAALLGGASPVATRPWGRPSARPESGPFDPAAALDRVAAAAGITARNAHDLPRVLAETPPTAAQTGDMTARLKRLGGAASRLAAVLQARGFDPAAGPARVPGTYVVFFRLDARATGVRIGQLGTFDFPAGVYAYLGSAFGGGGVWSRTNRHLTRNTPRRWNIDHLKPLCVPVAVWWTYDRDKVEFLWADVLAALPGASFPARRFGAADNSRAVAHLARFDDLPSFAEFARLARAAAPGHAPVYGTSVVGWVGAGWPK